MNNFPKKIAIIGVGLIGGSIALGLKKHFGAKITIFGSCSHSKRTKLAHESGIIDTALDTIEQIPKDVNFIIIATPVRISLEILKKLSGIKFKNCQVIDVGSTKKFVIDRANQLLKPPAFFIGTHPMAGSEMSGFENASVNLFRNKPWIICSSKDQKKLELIKELINILGAKPMIMDAQKHDELSIWASHIFLSTSSILVNTIAKQKNWPEIAKIASTGFRDTTRLASDNPKMKADIVATNKIQLLMAIGKFKDELDIFSRFIRQSDEKSILNYFQYSKKIRDQWLTNYFS